MQVLELDSIQSSNANGSFKQLFLIIFRNCIQQDKILQMSDVALES